MLWLPRFYSRPVADHRPIELEIEPGMSFALPPSGPSLSAHMLELRMAQDGGQLVVSAWVYCKDLPDIAWQLDISVTKDSGRSTIRQAGIGGSASRPVCVTRLDWGVEGTASLVVRSQGLTIATLSKDLANAPGDMKKG